MTNVLFTVRRIAQGANFSPDQAEDDTADCNGHGTHVAGTQKPLHLFAIATKTYKPLDVVQALLLVLNMALPRKPPSSLFVYTTAPTEGPCRKH
jgi:hypothetical protein